MLSGINDTRHLAYHGLRKDGTQGLVHGLAKGVTGHLGKNIVVGVAGLASNVVEGVAATVDVVADAAVDQGNQVVSGASNMASAAIGGVESVASKGGNWISAAKSTKSAAGTCYPIAREATL